MQFTFSTYSIRQLGFVVWNYIWLRCVDVIWCVIKCRRQKWRRGVKHILWCSVLIPGFLVDKEASQSWSSVSGFRVEGRPPDHKTVMLTTTANSCNNCIETFHTYLAEDEFPLTETGELVLTIILINYFALLEQMTLSPAHMIAGVEPSSDDIF